jgi:glycosyltransferase involved in cell wall biosynthesis
VNPSFSTLVLTRFRPDQPTGGAALRNWLNLQCLAGFGPVDVVSIGTDATGGAVAGVRKWQPFAQRRLEQQKSCAARLRSRLWWLQPGRHPSLSNYEHTEVTRWLERRLAECRYTFALVEELSLARYIPVLRRGRCQVIFDAHNVESTLRAELADALVPAQTSLRKKIKTALLNRRMGQAERRAVETADLVWACSAEDARQLETIGGPRVRVSVVPNGVDVDAYAGNKEPGVDWSRIPITLLFPGAFSYYPNESAALRLIEEVLPALRARGHEAHVVLLGRDPTEKMRAASRRDASIQITGSVPSVMPYLARPCVITLPITLGGGTRFKILEAFAASRPVVSTRKGAEGIAAFDGEHLLLREQPEAIAEAAIAVWKNPHLRSRLCGNALDLVRQQYSRAAISQAIAQSLQLKQPVGPTERATAEQMPLERAVPAV